MASADGPVRAFAHVHVSHPQQGCPDLERDDAVIQDGRDGVRGREPGRRFSRACSDPTTVHHPFPPEGPMGSGSGGHGHNMAAGEGTARPSGSSPPRSSKETTPLHSQAPPLHSQAPPLLEMAGNHPRPCDGCRCVGAARLRFAHISPPVRAFAWPGRGRTDWAISLHPARTRLHSPRSPAAAAASARQAPSPATGQQENDPPASITRGRPLAVMRPLNRGGDPGRNPRRYADPAHRAAIAWARRSSWNARIG
jgi:hypothetical protein